MEEAKNKIRDKIRNLTARMSRSNSASPSSSSTSQQQQKVFASAGVIKRSQDHPEVTRVMQALPPCAAQPETLYVSKEKVVVKEVPKLSTCVPVGDRDDISDAMSYGLHCKNHKHGRDSDSLAPAFRTKKGSKAGSRRGSRDASRRGSRGSSQRSSRRGSALGSPKRHSLKASKRSSSLASRKGSKRSSLRGSRRSSKSNTPPTSRDSLTSAMSQGPAALLGSAPIGKSSSKLPDVRSLDFSSTRDSQQNASASLKMDGSEALEAIKNRTGSKSASNTHSPQKLGPALDTPRRGKRKGSRSTNDPAQIYAEVMENEARKDINEHALQNFKPAGAVGNPSGTIISQTGKPKSRQPGSTTEQLKEAGAPQGRRGRTPPKGSKRTTPRVQHKRGGQDHGFIERNRRGGADPARDPSRSSTSQGSRQNARSQRRTRPDNEGIIQTARKSAENALHAAEAAAADTATAVQKGTKNIIDSATEVMSNATATAYDTFYSTKKTAEEKAAIAQKQAADTVNQAKKSALKTAEEAKKTTQKAAEDASNYLAATTKAATDSVQETAAVAADKASEAAKEATRRASDAAKSLRGSSRSYIPMPRKPSIADVTAKAMDKDRMIDQQKYFHAPTSVIAKQRRRAEYEKEKADGFLDYGFKLPVTEVALQKPKAKKVKVPGEVQTDAEEHFQLVERRSIADLMNPKKEDDSDNMDFAHRITKHGLKYTKESGPNRGGADKPKGPTSKTLAVEKQVHAEKKDQNVAHVQKLAKKEGSHIGSVPRQGSKSRTSKDHAMPERGFGTMANAPNYIESPATNLSGTISEEPIAQMGAELERELDSDEPEPPLTDADIEAMKERAEHHAKKTAADRSASGASINAKTTLAHQKRASTTGYRSASITSTSQKASRRASNSRSSSRHRASAEQQVYKPRSKIILPRTRKSTASKSHLNRKHKAKAQPRTPLEKVTNAVSDTVNTVAKASASAAETAIVASKEAAEGAAETVVEGTRSAAKRLSQQLAEKAEETKENVIEVAEGTKESMVEAAQDSVEAVDKAASRARESLGEATDSVVKNVSKTKEAVVKTAEETSKNVKRRASKAAEQLTQKAAEAKKEIEVKADQAAGVVVETAEEAQEQVAEAAQSLQKAAAEISGQVAVTADKTGRQARQGAALVKKRASDAAVVLNEKAQELATGAQIVAQAAKGKASQAKEKLAQNMANTEEKLVKGVDMNVPLSQTAREAQLEQKRPDVQVFDKDRADNDQPALNVVIQDPSTADEIKLDADILSASSSASTITDDAQARGESAGAGGAPTASGTNYVVTIQPVQNDTNFVQQFKKRASEVGVEAAKLVASKVVDAKDAIVGLVSNVSGRADDEQEVSIVNDDEDVPEADGEESETTTENAGALNADPAVQAMTKEGKKDNMFYINAGLAKTQHGKKMRNKLGLQNHRQEMPRSFQNLHQRAPMVAAIGNKPGEVSESSTSTIISSAQQENQQEAPKAAKKAEQTKANKKQK